MLELAEELVKRNHQVTVITTWPKYNLDQNSISEHYSEKLFENRIIIIRVKTLPHHNVNFVLRGLSQLIMPFQFILKLRQYHIQPDALIVYSPPLPLALVGSWLKRKKTRFVFNVQDLFPQNAIDLGVLKNPLQIRFFRALEGFAYRSADIVTAHSSGNKDTILRDYPNLGDKLQILHNWVDVGYYNSENVKIDFREKWKIKQKMIAVFAGVMGPSQYLELILHIAEQMQNETELLFLLVGDGIEKEKLKNIVQAKSLKNVLFKGFVSRESYPDLLKICSIGLVCLNPKNQTPVIPGKILGYMSAELPILALLHSSSDGHGVIKNAKCGISADSNDKDACFLAMQSLISKNESFAEMGMSGKLYASKNFSKQVCLSKLELMFESH